MHAVNLRFLRCWCCTLQAAFGPLSPANIRCYHCTMSNRTTTLYPKSQERERPDGKAAQWVYTAAQQMTSLGKCVKLRGLCSEMLEWPLTYGGRTG